MRVRVRVSFYGVNVPKERRDPFLHRCNDVHRNTRPTVTVKKKGITTVSSSTRKRVAASTAPNLSGSGRADMLRRPAATARAAVATGASG